MDDLPTDYDAVILGTGMTECIVAAALARIGYSVLHMDRNDYYSADWASFHFEGLLKWISKQKEEKSDLQVNINPTDYQNLLQDGEDVIPLQIDSSSISQVETFTYVSNNEISDVKVEDKVSENSFLSQSLAASSDNEHSETSNLNQECEHGEGDLEAKLKNNSQSHDISRASDLSPQPLGNTDSPPDQHNMSNQQSSSDHQGLTTKWTFNVIQKQWRKFNIDLAPKLLYCRGSFVDLLISSDVAKYCEFKTVTRILTYINGKLEQVPCSRADVFSSKAVSMIEKRMMMKFITFCVEFDNHPEEYSEFEDQPFGDFLKSRKLTPNVQHYILHSIAMVPADTSTIEGLRSCQFFLQSLGRYGNTAFLWPVYGSGELPQCFVRMCAVFGGVYCLRRTAVSLIMDTEDNKYKGIIDTEGKRLNSKWIIMDASYAADSHLPKEKPNRTCCRCILLTDKSVLESDSEQITLLHLPSKENGSSSTMLLELSASSLACPKDIYVVHLTCIGTKSAKEELEPVVNQFFFNGNRDEDSGRPHVLWSLYFNCADLTQTDLGSCTSDNVFITRGPGMDLDFTQSVEEARLIFEKICPGEDFLPRAPNPEDIIYDDGKQNPPADPGFQDEKVTDTKEEKVEGDSSQIESTYDLQSQALDQKEEHTPNPSSAV